MNQYAGDGKENWLQVKDHMRLQLLSVIPRESEDPIGEGHEEATMVPEAYHQRHKVELKTRNRLKDSPLSLGSWSYCQFTNTKQLHCTQPLEI